MKLLSFALVIFSSASFAQSVLQCGTPATGRFGTVGQIDRYTIGVNIGDVMTIRATNGYMELYDPSGRSVATASVSRFGQSIRTTATVTGTFLLLISQESGYGADYSLALQRLNRPCGTATLSCGEQKTGTLPGPIAMVSYAIDVNAGDVMTIRSTNGFMELYDPSGKSLATASVSRFGQSIANTATATGTYLLLISLESGYGDNYTLAFQRLNRPCGANPFSCGEQKTGTLPGPIAMIPYAISVNAGDVMAIRSTNGFMELYDPAGKSVATASVSRFGQSIATTATAAGTYLLLHSLESGYGASYITGFQRLNRPCGTSPLVCGQQVSGSLPNSVAMISYSISATLGNVMSIRSTNGYMELYDPSGKSVATASVSRFGQSISTTAGVTGTYLLLISLESGYGSSYALTYLTLNSACPTTISPPILTSLAPNTATAGGASFTLTANGSGFVSGAGVLWNGTPLTTTFVSASQLTAAVPANLIAASGSATVSVQNSGGLTSNALTFITGAPQLTLSSISPNSATAGGAAFVLSANGSGFVNGTAVLWNGTPLTTTFISASQLTAAVPANLIAAVGPAIVSVQNSGGLTSNGLPFSIVPQPSLSSISPNSATAGGAAFILTASGSGFASGASVLWNGAPLTTTFVSASQLTASVPANLIAAQGTANISIRNLGGSTSNVLPLAIGPQQLTLSSLAPNSAAAGGPAFTLSANGTGFVNGTTLLWNGAPLTTTYINASQLSGAVPASLIAAQGTASVSVQNPGGLASSVLPFTISPLQLTLSNLSPSSATAGGAAFTLITNGSGFLNGATVLWNGTALTTSYVNGNQLSAAVPANLIAAQGTASVSVQNPGGLASSVLPFTVTSQQLTLSSLAPNSIAAGGAAFTLTANGTGFVNGATVLWNGAALTTSYVNGNQLSAAVPANLVAAQGSASVSIQNPGGLTSSFLPFTINPPQLTLSSLSPNSVPAGSAAFTLIASGSGFLNGATVLWNGAALATSYVNGTQLSAVVPANLIAAQGTASVSMQNPGALASNVLPFTINPQQLTLSSLSANSVAAGSATFTLVASGSGFLNGATVLWNGAVLTTSYVSGTQLSAIVQANLIAAQGSASVSVQNPGGLASNVLTFTISPQPGGFTILTASPLPNGTFGVAYAQGIIATGGTTPYKGWSLVSGSLPPGLSLTAGLLSGTELLSGTPASGGNFSFALQVTDNSNAIATKQFSLTVTGGPTTLSSSGIVNSASYAGGSISPGEIVTIFGSFPGPPNLVTLQLDNRGYVATNLGGTQALFDGAAAPLIYAVAGQISAIVPYGVTGKSNTQVQISYQSQLSNSVALPVTPVVPGIFTADSSGRGQGAIVNQDGTVNSTTNPAASGSIVFVYATGEGQTNPGGVDGKPSDAPAPTPTNQPVTATVGGLNAQVLYAGGVPGLVAGLLQVNIQLPSDVAPGSAVPVVLAIGGKSSQANVTFAIR